MRTFAKDDLGAWSQFDSFRVINKLTVEKGTAGRLEIDDVAELVVVAP